MRNFLDFRRKVRSGVKKLRVRTRKRVYTVEERCQMAIGNATRIVCIPKMITTEVSRYEYLYLNSPRGLLTREVFKARGL
jgi:hypothetical protein